MAQIWSIYDKNYRLVLGVSDEPGIFNFTKPTDDEVDPIECDYATLQCYDLSVEPDVLNLLFAARDIEEFLDSLSTRGYKVITGRPQPMKFAKL